MRAFLGRLYRGLQGAAALYVLAVLGLPSTAAPESVTTPAPIPVVEGPSPPEPRPPDAPVVETPRSPESAPSTVATETKPAPPRERDNERPKPAIGFNIPEGQFDFEPAGAPAKLGKAEPEAFPFGPPEPAPAVAAPPLIYRRGRFRGPMRVMRNPWSDPANLAFNDRGNAARARAFAFDDRPEPAPGASGTVDPATVLKSWRRDIEQFRVLAGQGHSEEELKHRLGDRYSSVRWAAMLDVGLDELPSPTDSYAAALARDRKQAARR